MILNEQQKAEIKSHAIARYEDGKEECCGFISESGQIIPCQNVSETPAKNFVISTPCRGRYAAIYHSHTTGLCNFSPSDGLGCKNTKVPWVLYNVPTNDFKIIDPSGDAPYLDRDFCWWVNDCYSLVKDFYQREFSIDLIDYDRPELSDTPEIRWQPDGWNGFEESTGELGFIRLGQNQQLQRGDVALFALHGGVANHLGIIDDVDRQLFLHQLMWEPSRHDIWADSWQRFCVGVYRHKEVINGNY
jgi:proteasome lid subunit RPN8/RPN11